MCSVMCANGATSCVCDNNGYACCVSPRATLCDSNFKSVTCSVAFVPASNVRARACVQGASV
jgi:hypothetical protein